MSNIITANVKIKGTRPLLWHAFTPEAIPLKKSEKSGVAGNDPDEWRKTVLVTSDRQLFVEGTYIFGTLRDGARHSKKGRGSLQPFIVATLQVLDEKILVDRFLPVENELTKDPTQSVYIDVRSVKNPVTRARNVRYRIAACPGWIMVFTIEWDKTIINRQEMHAVVLDSGRLVGIGDGRSVGFGRFTMEEFNVIEEQ